MSPFSSPSAEFAKTLLILQIYCTISTNNVNSKYCVTKQTGQLRPDKSHPASLQDYKIIKEQHMLDYNPAIHLSCPLNVLTVIIIPGVHELHFC